MNDYTFEQLEIGTCESFEVKITQDLQEKFTNITGDVNPIHLNDDYAKEKMFAGKLVYGMLTAAFYSTLVGVYLPGKRCLFQECYTLFNRPVYIGDLLKITGTIIEKQQIPHKRITIKGLIKKISNDENVMPCLLINDHRGGVYGELKEITVSKAKLVVGLLDDKPAE